MTFLLEVLSYECKIFNNTGMNVILKLTGNTGSPCCKQQTWKCQESTSPSKEHQRLLGILEKYSLEENEPVLISLGAFKI